MADIAGFVSHELMQTSLRKCMKDDALIIESIESSRLDLRGEHFGSGVGHIQVNYVNSEGQKKTLRMFVKYLVESRVEMAKKILFTMKENRFYDTILPAMERFLQQSSSPHITLNFPTCYYSNYDQVRDLIALEDLKKKGFRTVTLTSEGHDLAHAKLAFKALADFHSVSFVMMKKTGYPNLEQCPYLEETILTTEAAATFQAPVVKCFQETMKTITEEDGHREIVSILRRIQDNVMDISIQILKNAGSFKVLCHRDPLSPNMMFRYDTDDKTPTDVVLLDMQITSISSLTTDLNYYMFFCTSIQFRKKHTAELQRYYYDSFVSNVSSLGVDDCGFTFDEFVEDYRRRNALLLVFLPSVLAYPIMDKSKLSDPGEEEKKRDAFVDFIQMVTTVAKDPKIGPTFKQTFLETCEEMKYSIEHFSAKN